MDFTNYLEGGSGSGIQNDGCFTCMPGTVIQPFSEPIFFSRSKGDVP